MGLRAAVLLAACCALLALTCTGGDEANSPGAAPASTGAATEIAGAAAAADSTAATVALATPTVTTPPPDGPYGGVMVLANRGDPPSGFDTMRTSSIALHHAGGALFGPGNLVMRCRENLYLACPYLATAWTVDPSQTEWTFTLRDDVLWHDGTPFTAADVELWFDLALNGYESDGEVRGYSPALSLYLCSDARRGLRFWDPAARDYLPTYKELREAEAQASEERDRERSARIEAERRAAEAEAETARLRNRLHDS